jgi:hypothetical protein
LIKSSGLVNAPALDDAFAWLMDLSSRTSTYPHPEPLHLMHQYRHDDRRDVEPQPDLQPRQAEGGASTLIDRGWIAFDDRPIQKML